MSLFFGNARTALKYGLRALNFKPGDRLLLPDFICDAVLHPLESMKIQTEYYPVDNQFVPNWSILSSIVNAVNCNGLMMVHYFGQPGVVHEYQEFCARHNLVLIEDNAHGYGGTLNERMLGTFGDIGISSPRKILHTPSGGVLYLNKGGNPLTQIHRATVRPLLSGLARYYLGNYFPEIKSTFRRLWNYGRDWSDPSGFREIQLPDHPIDGFSLRCIQKSHWYEIGKGRRENWMAWSLFAERHGLISVFSGVHPESCSWAYPAYAKDLTERNKWLNWGVASGKVLFPWPSLPQVIIQDNGPALARWQRLVCFALDRGPSLNLPGPR